MEWVETCWDIPIKSWCADLEEKAFRQAENLAKHPAAFRHIALMPDAHMGYGMPIGGVMATKDVIIPNAIGLDIGCGMKAIRTNLMRDSLPKEKISKCLSKVREYVPVGFKWHEEPNKDSYIWGSQCPLYLDIINENYVKAQHQLGTLGGGNHFLEIQVGNDNHIWLMIHSGSRNLGKQIGEHYHQKALHFCKKWYSQLPSDDLAFLPIDSEIGNEYLTAMNFALLFASENRKLMMDNFLFALQDTIIDKVEVIDEINIHHNYAALEHHFGQNVWVHRKGATSAKKSQHGIIPGSMGTPSYIVEGLGNPESFMSCSHGAGRKMGRMQASRELTEQEANEAMNGIEFSGWGKNKKGETDLGEAPQAYKDIDEVMEAQKDLVKILVKLEPLGVVKG